MPLRPMRKSPRFTDASIDVNWTGWKRGRSPSFDAMSDATSTSKPTTRSGSRGSASTKGEPPSASPPHRSSAPGAGGCAAASEATAPTSSAADNHAPPNRKRVRRLTAMLVSMMEEPRLGLYGLGAGVGETGGIRDSGFGTCGRISPSSIESACSAKTAKPRASPASRRSTRWRWIGGDIGKARGHRRPFDSRAAAALAQGEPDG